ncbi:uncharacterized protein LOC135205712 isoform X9 [Macrobrachium nipponense]|uniref:uncharacterized protein LOC135205712 isoform X9 n=1 Tax=Macrobrachium nipponense TaxID=159736 RepID=UPI0030C828E8
MAYGGGETPQMALDRAIKAGVVEARRDSTFYCNVCEKALKSKDTIKAHLRTNVHSKNSIDYDCAPRRKTVQQQKAMPREPSGKSTSARSLQDISKDSVTSDDLERAIRLGVVIEPKRPGDSYYCSSCEKPLKTKQTMRAHLSTPTHLSEIQKVMPKEPSGKSTSVRSLQATPKGSTTSDDLERAIRLRVVFEPDSPGDSYYCSSCEKHLKTKQTMRAHLSTPTHLSKTDVRTAIPQFLSSPGPQKQVAKLAPDGDGRVNICNSSKHGSSRHYDRANPVEKAFADGILVDEGAGKDSKGPFWCSVCNQTLKTFGKLSAHLSSKKHNGKLVKKNLCAGGKDDQRCNGETSDSSGSDSCGSESYSSSPSDSDSCDDDEDDEDERLVSKALRDGILQDDTLTHPMSPYWCKVCLLSLRQYRRLAGHLRSNKHRAKVEACCYPVLQQEKDFKVSVSKFEYSNNYASKGRVFVFNVLKDRPGAEADTKNIKETFQRLGYEVSIDEDFTKDRLYSKITKIQSDKTLADARALIVFILSHGEAIDTFICSDKETANLSDIKRAFTNSKCPALKGKPKIFFANFCRGCDIEIYMHDERNRKFEALVDTVVVHASHEGVKALRSKDKGTVFVQSLCEVLSNTEISKKFRVVYYCLHQKMASKRGTTPMLTDYVFKEFTF